MREPKFKVGDIVTSILMDHLPKDSETVEKHQGVAGQITSIQIEICEGGQQNFYMIRWGGKKPFEIPSVHKDNFRHAELELSLLEVGE